VFIPPSDIPDERTITYGRLVCDIHPHKAEQHRVRLTVGGDRINYPGDTATKNADLTTSNCLWDSTVSTPGARYMCADVKKFYLNTLLDRPEYMQLALIINPQEIIDKYKLMEKERNGKLYIRIDKGMYGLPQAGRLANNLLVTRLAPHGYLPCTHTHGLWRHDTKPITFTLAVDDFRIKYLGKENADHLLNALKEHYEVTEDWAKKLYCGISLDWNYHNRTVDLSMPGYIANALHKFQHKHPDRPQHAPYPARTPQYGATIQITPEVLDSPSLTPQGSKRIQQVVSALLYYGRAIDGTIMTAIGSLASQQATATEDTEKKLTQLLNYCSTHPDATIRYHASNMILNIHSDAGYLNEPEARSRAGEHFLMSSTPKNGVQQHNGSILT
jgi:hypothetical protein